MKIPALDNLKLIYCPFGLKYYLIYSEESVHRVQVYILRLIHSTASTFCPLPSDWLIYEFNIYL